MLESLITADDAPWKQRFRAPVIAWTTLAATNPARGLVTSNPSGVMQLYAWEVATGKLHQITQHPTGKAFGAISPDGRYIYYHDDQAGNEIGHYVRVPFEGGPPDVLTPGLPDYPSFGLHLSRRGDLVAFTLADADGYHLYGVRVGPDDTIGVARHLLHRRTLGSGAGVSADGTLALFRSSERSGKPQFALLVLQTTDGTQIAELWDGPETSVEAWGFSPRSGDVRILATSNRTSRARPLVWNPFTGERHDLPIDALRGDVEPVDWSADGQHVLLCQTDQAIQHLYVFDLQAANLTPLDHPDGTFTFFGGYGTYFSPTDEIYAAWQDAIHPPQLIALDAQRGTYWRTVLAAGPVPPGRPWRSVTFPSSDGQAIQGWLGVPDGDGPFPTILHMIGGPGGVEMQRFAPPAQAWLDHGFAFLTINYRGCSTFGRAFEEQIWGKLGFWEVEDMAAAHTWLVQTGIAQPDEILLTGGSYGGYLTLMGLGKRPDLWTGGMAQIAIADWSVQFEDTADTLRGVQVALLGGTPQEQPEQYATSSPITYAEHVTAPVLVIQGRNDTRCPARPMELYEAKLRSLGKQIEIEWFDAGHGSLDTDQRIHHQELMLGFAFRVLG